MAAAMARPGTMLDVIDVDELDLDAVRIATEVTIEGKRRLDLVVMDDGSDQPRPLLVVEYKVDADEGEDQTKDYAAWARTQAFDLAGRRVLPLLVFLCPDRDDETEPEPPFVHVAYELYCQWLDGLRPANDRARMLVAEFRSCLAQRDDVEAPELAGLLKKLQTDHAAEIAALAGARGLEREPIEAVLRRHDVVFQKLGVPVKRRFSLGQSPFVDAVRDEMLRRLARDLWALSGDDCVVARFKPALDAGERLLGPGARLLVQLFVTRPKRGRARFALSVRIRSVSGRSKTELNGLREKLAADLRQRLAHTPLGKHLARRATVAAVKVPVDTTDGDTSQAVEKAHAEVCATLDKVKTVEPVLDTWCAEVLPGLVGQPPVGL